MSKSQELKLCPFCGGSAHIRPSQDADGCFWSWVQCNQCGARTQGDWVSNRSETCPIFYEGVREEWNRRPADSEQDAPDAERWRAFANGCVFPKFVFNNGNSFWQYGEHRSPSVNTVADLVIMARQTNGSDV